MRKIYLLLTLIIFVHLNLFSQNSDLEQHRFIDNVRFGGGINIGVGNNHSYFTISPSALYDFSSEFSTGLSFKYMYFKNKSIAQRTTNLYGGSILSLYRPSPNIQLSGEYERLKKNERQVFQDVVSLWQSALFVGVEYITGNIAMGLRYDVLYKKTNLIYPSALSPVFRVYF